MSREELIAKLNAALDGWLDTNEQARTMPNDDIMIVLRSESLLEAMGRLRWDSAFEFSVLMNHLGVDYKDRFGVIYNIFSPSLGRKLTVKAYVEHEKPVVHTLESLYRGINWYERETYDMLGIRFRRHSNLRRLLLPEDWKGHPLRKDYVYPESYGGQDHSREDLLDSCASGKTAKGDSDG